MPTKQKWTRADLESEAARFDWSRVNASTDDEIEAAESGDPDPAIPSDKDLEDAVRARAERLRQPAAE